MSSCDGSSENERILTALEVYGLEKFADEFSYCVQEILKVCMVEAPKKLRDIIFSRRTTNAFPAVFAILLIAFHELIVNATSKIGDYKSIKDALNNLDTRIETGRKSTSVEERRRNIDAIKGLIQAHFHKTKDLPGGIYNNHTTQDISALIRRSEIELPNYELKQGLLQLVPDGRVDEGVINKVVATICAIANNGPERSGKILVGVTDKERDAQRVLEIDGIEAQKVGRRLVVGVNREAKRLGKTTEQYFSLWKKGIGNSDLSGSLRDRALSNIDYNSFYGLGVIVISVPTQTEISYVGDDVYFREGDETKRAEGARQIAEIAKRFIATRF